MERRRRSRHEVAPDPMTKVVRRRDKPRERWLLTRKTWKYMSDAGRRLIPEGSQNRPEDVPRLEAYFQEVCAKEPRFLLWRKSSYPGALPRPRRKKRARGGSVRAHSPVEEVPMPPSRPTDLYIGHISGGRFDIAKLRRDFFAAPSAAPLKFTPPSGVTASQTPARASGDTDGRGLPDDDDESCLVDLLRKYLKVEDDSGPKRLSESEELVRALRKHLKLQSERLPTDSDTNPTRERTLLENLGRYYIKSPNRDSIVQDLLTDRNLMKRLYHDLRKTKPYRGARSGGGSGNGGGSGPSGFGPSGYLSAVNTTNSRSVPRGRTGCRFKDDDNSLCSPPMSPPPLIEVVHESLEDRSVDCGTQTHTIPDEVLAELERAYREKLEAETAPTSPTSPPPDTHKPVRRRSSVDHDDVSQSVSDTIKRYLRMARKKSVDGDKADRFKRINYDKNLRNIKPKMVSDFDDDATNKGCQTDEGWILTYRDLHFESVASTPTSPRSPVSPSASHSFLSTLLGRSAPAVAPSAGGMQKSRSSSSVVQSVSKRLWRTRSRSSSRVAASWTPQGSCCWADGAGRCVRLTDSSLLTLSDVERRALQQAALARLQQINLGTAVKIPEETAIAATKPKRRAYLLKRKALTTGFFDQSRTKDDKDKEATPTGSVFGVPLAQCVESERALRRQHGGSRASLASLSTLEKGDDSESCDSGDWGWSGLEEAGGGGPRVPSLVSACLVHLRRQGMHTTGLFRVSSSKKRVRQLREEWERSQEAALDAAVSPHDVATLLKEFLRDLPDPLLCRDLYPAFLQTQKIQNRRYQWEALRLIVQLLPAAHRDTLNALLTFLAQLASNCGGNEEGDGGNKMDAANIATIFAPNILHRNKPNETASVEQLSERADVINVVRLLVERQTELWTLPAELLHEAYIHLAHNKPDTLDELLRRRAECVADPGPESSEGPLRPVWSREQFLHGAAATGGPGNVPTPRRSEKSYSRSRRTREIASDTSSGSLSSAMTIVTRVRPGTGGGAGSSSEQEVCSSGVVCSAGPHSAPDSNDSASDYNETLGGSDDDSCVITASLHIPGAFPRTPQPSPRRRSSGSESSTKRDSAVGSSSCTSSPPASPPPPALASTPLRVTLTSAAEVRKPSPDIDRLMGLSRERNTSDARAVMLRQQDDAPPPSHGAPRSRTHTSHRRDVTGASSATTSTIVTSSSSGTLYKRGELISSARQT